MTRTEATIVRPPGRVQEFEEVFGSATVPVRRREVLELDLDALSDEQRARLIDHLAAKFGVDEETVRAVLRREGVAIVAEDCVVSSDGLDFL